MSKLLGRKISNRTVEGLFVEGKDVVFWDPELLGFGVRVYPSGARVYVVQTRAGGTSKRVHGRPARGAHGFPGPPAGGARHRAHQGRGGAAGARREPHGGERPEPW